jgi:electron transport complex protein RnfG
MNQTVKNTLSLLAITAVAGLLLGTVYEGTAEARKTQSEKTQQKAYQTVFTDAVDFVDTAADSTSITYTEKEVTLDGVVKAMDKDGALLGCVVTVTAKEGYGGDIQFSVGVDTEGNVTGISYLSISETAGLGMKAKDESFVDQYVDGSKDGDGTFVVNKDGGDGIVIDAISGATITSRAVTKGVNAACQAAASVMNGGAADE